MPIKSIDNDYQSFTVTDTLHQLVDKLTLTFDTIDSNTRQFDSSVSDLERIIHADSGLFTLDSDLTVYAANATFEVPLEFAVNSETISLTTWEDTEVSANRIVLTVNKDVTLHDGTVAYGSLVSNKGDLRLLTNSKVAVSFDSEGSSFPGVITMPQSGTGSPLTVSKTVDGAISELVTSVSGLNEQWSTTGEDLISRVTLLEDSLTKLADRLSSVEMDVSYLLGLNIENNQEATAERLTDIESRLFQIGV